MSFNYKKGISRRRFIKSSTVIAGGTAMLPWLNSCSFPEKDLMKRSFGKLNHQVTTFGLGGQASIQWTPEDVDPVAIILKAFDKGVNYFDTSNMYGPSQSNYGKAFEKLDLIPNRPGYNEELRKSIFLTSKTHIRWAKGGLDIEGINNWTDGPEGSHTIDDIKRSLTLVFGDGKGEYPEGAYLDMVLIHDVSSQADVDAVYEGLYNTDPNAERIGALAALRDYRDGTNRTGLNPNEEKRIRHIGFSGHYNPAVMMQMIQRDKEDMLEGMLVSINANDKLNFNMQNNVIPVAAAKNMGIIAMKVFADGAMYSKEARWSHEPDDVVRTVGDDHIPFDQLIQYSLTTQGIHTAIMGIGEISNQPDQCQLTQNIKASQIQPGDLSLAKREEIEEKARMIKNGQTNYFQQEVMGLTAPKNIRTSIKGEDEDMKVKISWDTAYAGEALIDYYEVWRNDEPLANIPHQPQISTDPFIFEDTAPLNGNVKYRLYSVDKKGQKVGSEVLELMI